MNYYTEDYFRRYERQEAEYDRDEDMLREEMALGVRDERGRVAYHD